jgi:hypothetical protein
VIENATGYDYSLVSIMLGKKKTVRLTQEVKAAG